MVTERIRESDQAPRPSRHREHSGPYWPSQPQTPVLTTCPRGSRWISLAETCLCVHHQKAAPDRGTGGHPELSLPVSINPFTEPRHQTRPPCNRNRSRQKQDHSTAISDIKTWTYQQDVVQTTRTLRDNLYPLRGQILQVSPF